MSSKYWLWSARVLVSSSHNTPPKYPSNFRFITFSDLSRRRAIASEALKSRPDARSWPYYLSVREVSRMAEHLGLLEDYLLRHPIPDCLRRSLAHEIVFMAQSISSSEENSSHVVLGKDVSLDQKVEERIDDAESHVPGLTAAKIR
jgi:hypothetical protein